jgi:penicillin-binding protein 1A
VAAGTKSPPTKDPYVPQHAPDKVRKRRGKRKSFIRRHWLLLLLLSPVVLALLGFLVLFVAYARIDLPDKLPPIQTTYLYDRNEVLLSTLHGAVDRHVIPLEEMSVNIQNAVIATEDHDFYQHGGVDPVGLVRAAWVDLRSGDPSQGASTITQQLVKNVYAGDTVIDPDTGLKEYIQPERSVEQKVREMLLAIKLEREFGKNKILAQYLNTVYFGHGAYGVEAAAQTYFDEPASELTVNQSAVLAATLHAPVSYDPIDHPYDNRFRRDYSIDQMVRYGYLDAATAAQIKKHPCCGTVDVKSTERIAAPSGAEYFVDYVRQSLIATYGTERTYGGGLQVKTSLDLGLQEAAKQAVESHLPLASDPEGALVSIDIKTGQILAMYGGRNWNKSKVNLATFRGGSGRQAGSAFKIFTLAAALKDGVDLHSYWYGPETMPIPQCPDNQSDDGVWHPVNAEGSGSGSLLSATAHSVNTIFAQVIAEIGPEKVVEMAHDLGIKSDLPSVCAITLGSVAVNPLEMTNAYATVARRGVRLDPTPFAKVTFPSERVDDSIKPQPKQVLETDIADQITYALEGVVTGGTGESAGLDGFQVAGKTGTANENVDAWFCGYTVQIATCVWVGYPNGEIPLENVEGTPLVYGGTIPAAIWHEFMTEAMADKEPVDFPVPQGEATPTSAPSYVAPPTYTYSPSPEPSASPSPEPSTSPSPSPSPSPTEPTPTKPSPTGSPQPSDNPSPTKSPKAAPG